MRAPRRPAQPSERPGGRSVGGGAWRRSSTRPSSVFAEVGYEAATTNQIAGRAGISPGSLYQYFANKAAIAHALSERYVGRLGELETVLLDHSTSAVPVEHLVDRIVDLLVAFHLAHPGARSLTAADPSPELAEATKELHDVLCGLVDTVIGDRRHSSHRGSRPRLDGEHPDLRRPAPRRHRRRPAPAQAGGAQLKAVVAGYWRSLEPRR